MIKHTPVISLIVICLLLVACGVSTSTPTSLSPNSPADALATARQEALVTLQAYSTVKALTPSPSPVPTDSRPAATPRPTATFQPGNPISLPSVGGPIPEGALARLGIGVIYTALVSPDSQYLAVGTTVGLFLYDLDTLDLIWSKSLDGIVGRMEWMPYGNIIAATHGSKRVLMGWEVPSGQKAFEFEHSANISGFAWSPDGKQMAVAWGGRSSSLLPSETDVTPRLTVWQIDTLSQSYTVELPLSQEAMYRGASDLTGLAWSPDGDLIAGVGWRIDNANLEAVRTGIVWEANSGALLHFLPQRYMNYLSFSPDSKTIATWTGAVSDAPHGSYNVRVWDVLSGELRFELEGHDTFVWRVAWHPDGSSLLSMSEDGVILQWDAYTGQRIKDFIGPSVFPYSLIWSRDARYFVSVGYSDDENKGKTVVWDAITGASLYTIDSPSPQWRIVEASLSSDDRWLVAYSWQELTLVDFASGKSVASLIGAPFFIDKWLLSWAPDGASLSSYYGTYSGVTTTTWDVRDFQPLSAYYNADFNLPVGSSIISPDNSFVLQTQTELVGEWWQQQYKSTIVIVRKEDNTQIARLEGPPAKILRGAWSPDSTYFAVAGGLEEEFILDTPIKGWQENAVTICKMESFSCQSFLGHSGQVLALAFSPDGRYLASGSVDGTVIIWQVSL